MHTMHTYMGYFWSNGYLIIQRYNRNVVISTITLLPMQPSFPARNQQGISPVSGGHAQETRELGIINQFIKNKSKVKAKCSKLITKKRNPYFHVESWGTII